MDGTSRDFDSLILILNQERKRVRVLEEGVRKGEKRRGRTEEGEPVQVHDVD